MNADGAAIALPRIERTSQGHRLVLDGVPTVLLAGQLHNSTPTSADLPAVLDRVARLGASAVIASASWSLVEREEGCFDLSSVDALLAAARAAGLRLVLLWFGAFKNASSTYAPRWVRADRARFPRARTEDRHAEAFTHPDLTPRPVLSVFSEALVAADERAFTALLTHLRDADPQHTVVMVQVENEVGLLRDSRDRSAGAEKAWASPVPAALLDLLERDVAELPPSVVASWERGGRRRSGTWGQVFEGGWEVDEVFMAWGFSSYCERLAAAGKAVKPLPLYANAWLGPQPGQPEAGDYPSGGPSSGMLGVWRTAAPSLDLLAPDVYIDDVAQAVAPYVRPDNPLFVPESRVATGNLFWSIGSGAIGFSVFGVDDIRAGSRLTQAYAILDGMTELIAAAQAEGRIAPVLLDTGGRRELAFDRVRVVVQDGRDLMRTMLLDAGVQAPPAAAEAASETDRGIPAPADTRAFGIVIQEGENEFLVVGQNLAVDFAAPGALVEIDSVEAGRFERGTWRPTKVVNGDERLMIVPMDEVGVARIRLLRLEGG